MKLLCLDNINAIVTVLLTSLNFHCFLRKKHKHLHLIKKILYFICLFKNLAILMEPKLSFKNKNEWGAQSDLFPPTVELMKWQAKYHVCFCDTMTP